VDGDKPSALPQVKGAAFVTPWVSAPVLRRQTRDPATADGSAPPQGWSIGASGLSY